MYEYLEYLKNPFVAGFAGGLLIVLVAYIDKHMNNRDFEDNYFYKVFFGVFILVAGLVYFATSGTKTIKQSGGSSSGNIGMVVKKLDSAPAHDSYGVMTDIPDF